MADSAKGKGSANDAEVDTNVAVLGEETEEERQAALLAKRIEQADEALAASEAKLERAQEDVDAAKASVAKMKAHRASLEKN